MVYPCACGFVCTYRCTNLDAHTNLAPLVMSLRNTNSGKDYDGTQQQGIGHGGGHTATEVRKGAHLHGHLSRIRRWRSRSPLLPLFVARNKETRGAILFFKRGMRWPRGAHPPPPLSCGRRARPYRPQASPPRGSCVEDGGAMELHPMKVGVRGDSGY
jgi:hypothetical protein